MSEQAAPAGAPAQEARLWRLRYGHVVAADHEVLLPAPLLQPGEVAADCLAHVIEVAFIAHDKRFPELPANPSRYRGDAKVAVQTTQTPLPSRPFARTGAAPTCR